MIQPIFGPFARLFLDNLPSLESRRAVIDLITDVICMNPYLDPHDPDTRKFVFYDKSANPDVYTEYVSPDWIIRYRVVVSDPPLGRVVEIVKIKNR